MSKNFTAPPLHEKLVDENGYITTVWQEFLGSLFQNNDANATQFAFQLPSITDAQRDGTISATNDTRGYEKVLNQDQVVDGLIFYNEDQNEFQARINGAWRSLDNSAV